MPDMPGPHIKSLSVAHGQRPYGHAETSVGISHDEMDVIAHQTPGDHMYSSIDYLLREQLKKRPAIVVVFKDAALAVPAQNNVVVA